MPEVITIIVDTTETIDINQSPSDPVAIISQIGSTGPPGQDGVSGATLHAELTDTDTDGHPASAITGLGGAAVLNVGTTAGTVAAGDDSRFTNSRTPTAHASSHAGNGSDPISALGPLTITNTATNTVPLLVKGYLNQDVDLLTVKNSSNVDRLRVAYDGGVYIGISGSSYLQDTSSQLQNLKAVTSSASNIPLVTKGAASQSANLQEWQSSAGAVLANIDASGHLKFGGAMSFYEKANIFYFNNDPGYTSFQIIANGIRTNLRGNYGVDVTSQTSSPTLAVKGYVAQSGNLHEWQNSAGTARASVTAAGLHKWASDNEQTTVGAAGAASALPASPTKYLKIVGSDGVTYVIPAFAVS